jgi:hypothetical protein
MPQKSQTSTLVVRLLAYFALALMLWLKFRSKHSVQMTAVVILFALILIIVNYYCARLAIDYLRSSNTQNAHLIARSTSVYVLVAGIFGTLACDIQSAASIISITRGILVSESSLGTAWLLGVIGLMFTWVGAYGLRIVGDRVDYFSFATGHRSLALHDIDHARARSGWFQYSDRFRPTRRIELLPTSIDGLSPIVINVKAFKKSDLDKLYEWLGEKLRHEE